MYNGLEKKECMLPDGNTLDLTTVGWTLPEIMFSSLQVPSDLDKSYEFDGLGQMVIDAISACTVDHRAQLYKSVVLTGGGSHMNGLFSRLHNDIRSIRKPDRIKLDDLINLE
eukprot:131775_1